MNKFLVLVEHCEADYMPKESYSTEDILEIYAEFNWNCPIFIGTFDTFEGAQRCFETAKNTCTTYTTVSSLNNNKVNLHFDVIIIEEAEFDDDGEYLESVCYWAEYAEPYIYEEE